MASARTRSSPFFGGYMWSQNEGTDGFCTVAPLLAGNVLGDKLDVHVSRLWPFKGERTTADKEHQKRLPSGFGVVQRILGHREHELGVQAQVKWLVLEEPTWEFCGALRENAVWKQYCEDNELTLLGKRKGERTARAAAPLAGGGGGGGGGAGPPAARRKSVTWAKNA